MLKRFIFTAIAASTLIPTAFAETADAPSTNSIPMQTVCDFLGKTGYYFLATTDGDQPRVRPFGTAAIFEGKLYIQTGKKKDVSKQIAANPKAEICAFDQPSGKWIRIAATLVDDPRFEAKEFMLEKYPSLKTMYKADDDNTQVLYLKDATATIYSFGGEPEIIRF